MQEFLKTKDEILAWLEVHDEMYKAGKYTLTLDEKYGFKVGCQGDVLISNGETGLDFIPVKFDYINGDFTIFQCPITSLEFCPSKISGKFFIMQARLTSLVGATQDVGTDFAAIHCNLTSLKGCPSVVKGDFDVFQNNLTDLADGPRIVGGDYKVNYNSLSSLKGSPEVIAKSFEAGHNRLTHLDYLCPSIGGSIGLSNNQLVSLKGLPEQITDGLMLSHNQLKSLEHCPKRIIDGNEGGKGVFYFNYNNITELNHFPERIDSVINHLHNPDLKDLPNHFAVGVTFFKDWAPIVEKHKIDLERKNLQRELCGKELELKNLEAFKL